MSDRPVYEIGKMYAVPTVRYPWFGRVADWPIIGPRHADVEFFNFRSLHYHVDHRFLTNRQVAFLDRRHRYSISYGSGLAAAYGNPLAQRDPNDFNQDLPHPKPIVRRLLCRREWVPYPHGNQRAVQELRAAFADKHLIQTPEGHTCPHRGVSLATIEPDENGVITCPLHGLRWCAKTGHAIPDQPEQRG